MKLPAGMHIESGYTDKPKKRARGSQNYVMTADVRCSGDMLEVETVRKTVSIINKENARKEKVQRYRWDNGYDLQEPTKLPRYYVKCQGRGPRVKHALAQGSYRRRYDQSLPLSLAERMDVYVYQR